jgi:flagellar biosynthesis chaperone FliJ
MKRFKYRGESFLKFLEHDKKKALKALKKAESIMYQLIQQFKNTEERIQQAFQQNAQLGKNSTSLQLAQDNNQFIRMLRLKLKDLNAQIIRSEEDYKEKHKALVDLQVQVKKIERHKELEHFKYRKVMKKQIQKQLDEMNATRKRGKYAESV